MAGIPEKEITELLIEYLSVLNLNKEELEDTLGKRCYESKVCRTITKIEKTIF